METINVGLWLPTRKQLDPISVRSPGMLLEEVKAHLLDAFAREPDVVLIDDLDFRRAHICNGKVFCNGVCFSDLDVFFWFGELDRGRDSFHIDVLDLIGRGTAVINAAAPLRTCLDKLQTQLCLTSAGIPVPDFIAFDADAVEHARAFMNGRAAVLKPRFGAFGIGITRVEDIDSLVDIVDYSGQGAHFLEEFICSPPENFIGINIVAGEIVSSYGKCPEKFRNWKVFDRARKGGGMVNKNPSDEQARIALATAEAIGLDVLGVDIIADRAGRNHVIDVNSFPGLYPNISRGGQVDLYASLVEMILQRGGGRRAASRRRVTAAA